MILAKSQKLTAQGASGSFGSPASGKEWIIKTISSSVNASGASGDLELVIDGVAVALSEQLASTDDVAVLLGAVGNVTGQALGPTVLIAEFGESVVINRLGGGGFTWDAHMSYLERDVPT